MNLFDHLHQLARPVTLPAGAVLFRRDEPSQSVYVVQSGCIFLLWPDAEDGAPMESLGPHRIIGLPAAINGVYSLTAKAALDSELGAVATARVVELLESDHTLCREALKLMGQEVARMRSLIAQHCSSATGPGPSL